MLKTKLYYDDFVIEYVKEILRRVFSGTGYEQAKKPCTVS